MRNGGAAAAGRKLSREHGHGQAPERSAHGGQGQEVGAGGHEGHVLRVGHNKDGLLVLQLDESGDGKADFTEAVHQLPTNVLDREFKLMQHHARAGEALHAADAAAAYDPKNATVPTRARNAPLPARH